MRCTVLLISMLLSVSSCIEEYDVSVETLNYTIIDAAIFNDSACYIQIKPNNGNFYIEDIAVSSVVIEGDDGTIREFTNMLNLSEEFAALHFTRLSHYYSRYVENGYCNYWCYYGAPFELQHTYTLTVTINDNVYTATEYMDYLPEIEDLKFYSRDTWEETDEFSPIIYFTDNQPDKINYYLFGDDLSKRSGSDYYLYLMPICDAELDSQVSGLKISLGMGAEEKQKSDGMEMGDEYHYEMCTISSAVYDFYSDLSEQFYTDGGFYQPNPSTPQSNITGENVAGLFIIGERQIFEGTVTEDLITDEW